jgi:hypothetical protein
MKFFQKKLCCEFLNIFVHVRTQFSKDDMEASDSSVCWIVDDDINGDNGVWVDLAAK